MHSVINDKMSDTDDIILTLPINLLLQTPIHGLLYFFCIRKL